VTFEVRTYAAITSKGLVLEIKHNRDDKELYNFETVTTLEKAKAPFNFDPYSNLNVNPILKKWGYFSGMTIGRKA